MDRHEQQQQFSQFARHVAAGTSGVPTNGVGVDSIQSSAAAVAVAAAAAAAANALAGNNNNTLASNNNEPSSQVRTLFVSGLPMDAKPRELYLLFRAYKVSFTLHCLSPAGGGLVRDGLKTRPPPTPPLRTDATSQRLGLLFPLYYMTTSADT